MRYRHALDRLLGLGWFGIVILCAQTAWPDVYSGQQPNDQFGPAASAPPRVADGYGGAAVPGVPAAPSATGRPADWPGQPSAYPDTGCPAPAWLGTSPSAQAGPRGDAATKGPSDAQSAGVAANPAEAKPCEDAQVLARVGSEVVLAGDVMAFFIHAQIERLDEPIPEQYREKVLKMALPRAIEVKLLYVEAKREIPEENLPHVEKEIQGYFDKKGIPELMERAKVSSIAELSRKLVELGTSLEWQQQLFLERALGQQWMSMKIKMDEPVSPEAMLAYYRDHAADYEHPARARWEEITIGFANCPSREAAYQKLAQLGNQVKDGLPFAEAARRGSDGVTATGGGLRDWTTRGSLVAKKIDAALFGLPVGELSPILESETGLHIVRVVEREDAHRTPFTEVQDEIRKKLQNARAEERIRDYVMRLKDTTPVWTVHDAALAKKNDPESNQPPQRR
ncbi:MAG: peptidyl-prolyl cis-trans isomerase [Pirellulales bacterium]|nr:peptidyl-prolyl cis-trans isomerase [Pirellulales bacterium]